MGSRVLHVFDPVAAEHQGPVGLGVRGVLVQNLLVDALGLVELVVAAEVVGPVVEIRLPLAVHAGQGLLRAAVLALRDALPGGDLQSPAAHLAFEYGHVGLPLYVDFFSQGIPPEHQSIYQGNLRPVPLHRRIEDQFPVLGILALIRLSSHQRSRW